jgi:hypothetical protein
MLAELFDIWGATRRQSFSQRVRLATARMRTAKAFTFDLDGFYWGDQKFMMIGYPSDREFYLGINSHLYLYFSQVLSYHYPNHHDHFHVDFNFAFKFRPESNAQTFFVQACLKYIFDRDLGNTGVERDGVDGIFGGTTQRVLNTVLNDEGLSAITTESGWRKFLMLARERAFLI